MSKTRLWRSERILQARAGEGGSLLRQHFCGGRLPARSKKCAISRRRLLLPSDAQLAYNGVPHWKISLDDKTASRNKLRKYCKALLKYEPDYVFTHVTRLVPSKGLWRDLRVLEHVELMLRARNETAVLFALTTEVPGRRGDDIRRMEHNYHWPVVHREGAPDLSHGEADYYAGVQEFNAQSRNVKVVFINQFGFDSKTCGARMVPDMEFMDIRKGSDAGSSGRAFTSHSGIAQVEPISFGGICIFTNVCGCAGFVEKITGGKPTPNVIVADYTDLPEKRPGGRSSY